MFLQDKAPVLVFHWGRRNQLDTQPDLLCWSPSHNKSPPSNHLEDKRVKEKLTSIQKFTSYNVLFKDLCT